MAKEILESLLFVSRLEGWRSAIATSWRFLLSSAFAFHRGFALRRSLRESIQIPPPEVDMTIREAARDDLPLLGTIFPPLRLKRIARKLETGERCMVGIRDQKAIGYVFAAFAGTPSTGESGLRLEKEEAYLWDGYALPEFRRQGVVRAINLTLCGLLQQEGYESTVLLVNRSNRAALGHCRKAGYRITDRVMLVRALGWKWSQVTPVEIPG
jgi:ribosomal protein S18 acetylase RimI-like enzyme